MEVRNRFSSIGSVVDDEAISCFVELALSCDTLRGGKKIGKDQMVLGGNGAMAGVMLFGDEKDVGRGLGSDVAEGKDVIVFVEDVGLSFPVDDLFEDRFGHGGLPDREFEEGGTQSPGAGSDKVDNFVTETLAGGAP